MQNPYIYLMKLAWQNVGSRKPLFILTYTFVVIASLVNMLDPLIIGFALNSLQSGGDDVLLKFTGWLLLATLLTPIFWIFHGTSRIWENQLSFHIERRFRQRLFRILTRMPMAWHNDHHSGETHDKVEKAAHALAHFSKDSYEPLMTFVRAIVSVVAITVLFPSFGWLSVIALVIILMVMSRFDKYLIENRKTINDRRHYVAQLFFDYVTNIKSIITLRLEDLVGKTYSRGLGRIFPPLRKNIYVNETKWASQSHMLAAVTFVLLFLYVFTKLRSGEAVLIGSLFAFYGYIGRFHTTFYHFAGLWGGLVQQQTDAHAVDSIVKAYEKIEKQRDYKGDVSDWQHIKVSNLRFSHADASGSVNHLDDITINLHRGQNIALVGESGSGKSTLLHLLRGLYPPENADVTIDKKSHSLNLLSTITTLVPQDPEVFDNTIGYNISLGLEHTDAEIQQAIKLAKFDLVLERLEKGLETSIKERGVNLSGGEKQRLALARAIFTVKDSSLILMDESTSSVDSGNEIEIYKSIFKRFNDRCIVSAIHRLHLLPLFDVVYIIEKGRVIEQGSFAELTAQKDGVLASMWKKYLATLDNE